MVIQLGKMSNTGLKGQQGDDRETDEDKSSSGSESASTQEEERLKKLFSVCDRNGDGFIDRLDFFSKLLPFVLRLLLLKV